MISLLAQFLAQAQAVNLHMGKEYFIDNKAPFDHKECFIGMI